MARRGRADIAPDADARSLFLMMRRDREGLFRRGFTKEALKPGTALVIDGYRAKDGSHRANGRNLTLANGQTLFLGSSGTGAPDEKR